MKRKKERYRGCSVNHSGDSDSTGAITGNILGAYLGLSSISEEWVKKLGLKGVIIKMADDLLRRRADFLNQNLIWETGLS